MLVYAVDLGTTNVKVVLFDEMLRRRAVAQAPAEYDRAGTRVEFDPVRLFEIVIDLIWQCARSFGDTSAHRAVIAITGQAESFVLVDESGQPVRPGISWLDDRAGRQAAEMAERFDPGMAFRVTGQPEPSATWPAVKLRWLAEHEPASLSSAHAVLMIKDDLIRRLTGVMVGELTTRGFSYFYDVGAGSYWEEMLDFCSIDPGQLPGLVRAGLEVGSVRPAVRDRLPPAVDGYRVNAGALDHFCAMVGTGSYLDGSVSESAGTVLSLSMLAPHFSFDPASRISFHAGLRPAETLLFTGVDCGGAALDWFRRECLGGLPYDDLEQGLRGRRSAEAPFFLPYLTGVNPPDFFPDARGAFLGIELGHDRFDLAYAVEEGVAHLLRRNVDSLAASGDRICEIVSTGGGAASAFWSQLKSDVCGVDVLVPHEQEATCRGAAALALVELGVLADITDADRLSRPDVVRYRPSGDHRHERRYRAFEDYLDRLFNN
ncbi:FGGY-family carbohydrate kinase [Microlunatus ginsengisoli]|uniref:Xylulokinase n=1 Tax=Microlunatus ginsengisoli TaxID=363863 RepID=A0ABP6ZBD1_9ACTN